MQNAAFCNVNLLPFLTLIWGMNVRSVGVQSLGVEVEQCECYVLSNNGHDFPLYHTTVCGGLILAFTGVSI